MVALDRPYFRIAETLRQRILSGALKPNDKIGSQNALAKEFRVCAATIQKSLKELEREGLLWTHPGKGRFVADVGTQPRTWTLGVIVFEMDHLTHPVLSRRMNGIRSVVDPEGFHLSIFALNSLAEGRQNANGDRWMGLVNPSDIDGAVVVAQETTTEQVAELARRIPLVLMDQPAISEDVISVRLDYAGAAYAAAEHLASLGHQQIGLITPHDGFAVARDQHEGALLALRNPGARLERLRAGGFSEEEGRRLAGKALAQPNAPTALLCGSDELAIGALGAIREAGLRVPADISLIGWNDTLAPEEAGVALTTVRMDYEASGRVSTRLLLERLKAPETALSEERIPGELVVRASTAAPRQGRKQRRRAR